MRTQPQREELRYAVREILANAASVALTPAMIHRRVIRSRALDFEPELSEVADALGFLDSLGQVKFSPDPLGATPYYQITAEGTLAHERRPV